MLDLSEITDRDVQAELEERYRRSVVGTDEWRVFGACLACLRHDSFADTRTYPRPDHPDPQKRRSLEFLLAAIIVSLRTTLENEQKAMTNLMAHYKDAEDLVHADPSVLAALIRPAGMAESKSQRIIASLHQARELQFGLQTLEQWPLNKAREYLLSMPGIGPKAADCLLTIGLGHPSMVVDVNVFRFSVHLLGMTSSTGALLAFNRTSDVEDVKRRLDNVVGANVFLCQIVHTMLLLAGRRIGRLSNPDKCVAGAPLCCGCVESGMVGMDTLFLPMGQDYGQPSRGDL